MDLSRLPTKAASLALGMTLAINSLLVQLPCFAQSDSTAIKVGVSEQGLECRAAVTSVGALLVPDGLVMIDNGGKIRVLSDANQSVSDAELTGQLINVHAGTGGSGTRTGAALFLNGPSLPALDDKSIQDQVELVSGGSVSGHIDGLKDNKLTLTTNNSTRELNLNEVESIRSPRAFEFALNPPNSPGTTPSLGKITFTPTAEKSPPQRAIVRAMMYGRPALEHPKKRRALAIAAAIGAVAISFGVPTAIAVFTKHVAGLKGEL